MEINAITITFPGTATDYVKAKDAAGSLWTPSGTLTVTSSDANVVTAQVSNAGTQAVLFTSKGLGSATVTISDATQTLTVPVTVTHGPEVALVLVDAP